MNARPEWQRLMEGDVKGVIRPYDDRIRELRIGGLSLGKIAREIGKRRSYVQHRLLRIAAREEI